MKMAERSHAKQYGPTVCVRSLRTRLRKKQMSPREQIEARHTIALLEQMHITRVELPVIIDELMRLAKLSLVAETLLAKPIARLDKEYQWIIS